LEGRVNEAREANAWKSNDVSGERLGRAGFNISPLAIVALALLPKCPGCLAVYFGFVALFGVSAQWMAKSVFWSLIALGVIAAASVLYQGFRSGRRTPFFWVLAGLGVVLASRLFDLPGPFLWLGTSIFCGACLVAGRFSRP
jgi:uncharacterized membrane protein (DUF485 family)